jgi:hypothetical protein
MVVGRTLGGELVVAGSDNNQHQVEAGMAGVLQGLRTRAGGERRRGLRRRRNAAKASKMGVLWAMLDAQPPWEFRRTPSTGPHHRLAVGLLP